MSIVDFDKVDHDKVYRIVLFFAPVKDMTRFLFVHLFVLRDKDCNARLLAIAEMKYDYAHYEDHSWELCIVLPPKITRIL